jgi:hypothetical protein
MGSDWELQNSDAATASTDGDDDDLEITHVLEKKAPAISGSFFARHELLGCY